MSVDLRVSVAIEELPGRVFEALVEPRDLEAWFCEHDEIEPPARRYDFWGRHTPGAPRREGGRHALLEYDPPRRLVFAWAFRGGETRAAYDVAPAGSGAAVTLEHELPRGRRRREGAAADFWGGSLERLKAWVERGAKGYITDYATPPSADARFAVEIGADPDDVFRALIEPAMLDRYISLPGGARVEPRAGGSFDFGWGDDGGPVRILALDRGKRLSYSWHYRAEPETVVTWSLEGSGGRTRLRLVHSGFGDASLHEPYLVGWSFFLNRIKLLLETGQGRAAVVTGDDYSETAV